MRFWSGADARDVTDQSTCVEVRTSEGVAGAIGQQLQYGSTMSVSPILHSLQEPVTKASVCIRNNGI